MLKFHHANPDPKSVTQSVLKACKFMRDKNFNVSTVRRFSGKGGGANRGMMAYTSSGFRLSQPNNKPLSINVSPRTQFSNYGELTKDYNNINLTSNGEFKEMKTQADSNYLSSVKNSKALKKYTKIRK
jgi:hypothetical protein